MYQENESDDSEDNTLSTEIYDDVMKRLHSLNIKLMHEIEKLTEANALLRMKVRNIENHVDILRHNHNTLVHAHTSLLHELDMRFQHVYFHHNGLVTRLHQNNYI